MKDHSENSIKLMRELLGSIDFSDIEDLQKIKLPFAELMARAGDVELFYKNHLQKVIKLFIQKQLEFIGKNVNGDLMIEFSRGTINGLMLIDNWCKEQSSLSMSRFDEENEEEGKT